MPDGVEASEVTNLGTQGLERWSRTDETVEGVGRGQRASTSHGHLRGEAWLRNCEWPTRRIAAESGRKWPKSAEKRLKMAEHTAAS